MIPPSPLLSRSIGLAERKVNKSRFKMWAEKQICAVFQEQLNGYGTRRQIFKFLKLQLPIFPTFKVIRAKIFCWELASRHPRPPPTRRQGTVSTRQPFCMWVSWGRIRSCYCEIISDGIQISRIIREMDLDLLDLQVRTGITQMQKDCEEEETSVQQQVPKNNAHLRVPYSIQHNFYVVQVYWS